MRNKTMNEDDILAWIENEGLDSTSLIINMGVEIALGELDIDDCKNAVDRYCVLNDVPDETKEAFNTEVLLYSLK